MKDEGDERTDTLALWHKIVKRSPEVEHMTVAEFEAHTCRLEAELDDMEHRRDQIFRENGFMAPGDCLLFGELARGRPTDLTVGDLIAYLRLKKKRGHRQQKFLDIWDQYYGPRGDEAAFADQETFDRLMAIWESQEDAWDANRVNKAPAL